LTFSAPVHTCPGVQLAPCAMGTGYLSRS